MYCYHLHFFVYFQVLREILTVLPTKPMVRVVVIDFEMANWKAIRVLPHAKIRGCAFHWSQAVWRKVSKFDSKFGPTTVVQC